ncbi:MAG: hypothetical protein RJB66_2477 [Pseudomonadota bacterium]|jgi:ABC-type Fe3+ transport system permease subunit
MALLLLAILVFFLMSPYALLLSQFSLPFSMNGEDFFWAFKNTLLEALGSSVLSVILGCGGGLGLLWLRRKLTTKTYSVLEILFLLPTVLPSLFVVVSCLGFFQPFPYGKMGVILIQTVINVGLVSVLFSRLCLSKLSALGDLSLIEGAGRAQFLRVGVLSYLGPDIFYLFLYLFSMSMASFNVPLLVGGTSGTTIEVLIYENLVIAHNWSQAISLSLFQMVILGSLGLWIRPSNFGFEFKESHALLELAEWKWGLIFPALACFVILVPPIFSLPSGLLQLHFIKVQWGDLIRPALMSLLLGLLTGLILFLFLCGASIVFLFKGWRQFAMAYTPPSGILMGFSFFILARWIDVGVFTQIVLGLTLMFFVSVYRLSLATPLASLRGQIETASVLGANPFETFRSIVLPQIWQPLTFATAIGAMWACGDFALSSILSSEDFHLALMVKSLAGGYRLDAAQALMWLLYFVIMISFVFWWRLGDVFNRKFGR